MSTANAMMSLVQSVFVLVATGFSGVFVPLELRNKTPPLSTLIRTPRHTTARHGVVWNYSKAITLHSVTHKAEQLQGPRELHG